MQLESALVFFIKFTALNKLRLINQPNEVSDQNYIFFCSFYTGYLSDHVILMLFTEELFYA